MLNRCRKSPPGPGLVLLGLALCLTFATPAAAVEEGDYRFQRVGEAEGLAPDVITRLYHDRRGLLWVGTREGLFRFDGYTAQRFVNDPDDPQSLSDNSIRTIFQDRDDRMWFGSNTGGLCRVESGESVFHCLRPKVGDPATLSHESVYSVVQDHGGAIWVGTQSGLNRIEPGANTVKRVPFSLRHEANLGNEYVAALFVDQEGHLWVGTVDMGVYVLTHGEERFVHVGSGLGFEDSSAFSFLEDSAGNLWIGGQHGIHFRRRGEERFESLSLSEHLESGSADITALVESPSGRILAGSFSQGLFAIDPTVLSVTHHKPAPGIPGSLGEARITDVVIDPGGGIMVATWGAGLQRTTPSSRLFGQISEFINSKGLLSRLSDVESVTAARHGEIWAGSFNHGLLQLDAGVDGTELLSVPLNDLENPKAVVSVFPELPDKVWVGAVDGLIELDPTTLEFLTYAHDTEDRNSIGAGWVTATLRDRVGKLWVGTGGSGLWRMSGDQRAVGFVHDPGDTQSISGDYITTLKLDEYGYLWVGTRSHGFSRCQVEPFRCRRFDPAEGAALRHHYVTAFFRDSMGDWWIGTAGGGLHRAKRDTEGNVLGFDYIDERQGLLDSNIVSFVEDDDGSLWMGTRRGLARLSPDRRSVAAYLASDGLVSDVFNRNAAARDAHRLYFGTVSGIVQLPVGSPFRATEPAPLVFTQAQNLTLGEAMTGLNWADPEIVVDHGDVLQFGFALLDYEGGNQGYAYRLGTGSSWVELKSSRQITFGDLPPGRHELQVRGQNARGAISDASLVLQVVPPFWMTSWFRVAVLMLLAILVLVVHSLRMAGLQKRNAELQRVHAQREKALIQLQRSEAEVSEAAQGLRRLASRLESAKEEERQHISRELHDELGQTLTAAKISLQMLQNEPGVPGEKLQSAVGMMDSMIGQVRAISLDLRPPLLDEAGLVPALKSELKKVSEQTGIKIDFSVPDDIPSFPEHIETVAFRVSQEGVNNSLRHSGASQVSVSLSLEGDELLLTIEDDGCGFDVDEARVRAMRGEHLGLLGLDERVNAVGGRVRLESEPDRGTLLRIRLPVGE